MRSVDTNVLVRLITRDDLKQVAAAEKFVAGGAWVSHLVLAETPLVFESRFARAPHLPSPPPGKLLAHQQLIVQESDVVTAPPPPLPPPPCLCFSPFPFLANCPKGGPASPGTLLCRLA